MIKNAITFVLIVIMIFSFTQNCFASGDNITIVLNGETVSSDVSPVILNGRTMVPARSVFEKMGAVVSWDEGLRRVTVVSKEHIVNLTIDNSYATVNGVNKLLDAPPVIKNGRTLVPVRFISESLGYSVDWNEKNRIVYVSGSFSQAPQNTPSQPTVNNPPSQNQTSDKVSVTNPSGNVTMRGVTVSEIAGGVQIRAGLSVNVNPQIMTLDNPSRIVFDFYGVVQNFSNSSYAVSSSSVKEVRWGKHSEYGRIVVECYSKTNYKVTFDDTDCIITVSESIEQSTADAVVNSTPQQKDEAHEYQDKLPSFSNNESPLVYIDPGHGGSDSGAVGRDANGNTVVVEKDANLEISLKVRDLLVASGVTVKMTRDTDVSLGTTQMEDLVTRASLANEAGAVLFISIHNNAFTEETATGTTVLYAGLSANGDYGITGEELAYNIQMPLAKATGLRDRGIVQSPGMVVLKRTAMPAVIVECAFVTCPDDQKVLTNPDKINDIAYAIFEGVMTSLIQMK